MNKWIGFFLILSGCTKPLGPTCPGFLNHSGYGSVHWKSLPVHVAMVPEIPNSHREIIIDAMKTWNESFHGELFQVDPNSDNKVIELNPWIDIQKSTEQARTTITWREVQIFKTLVRVNTENFQFIEDDTINGVHLKSLMIHEFGHVLGLLHQNKTVMDPELASGQIRDQIEPILIEQIKCHYKK